MKYSLSFGITIIITSRQLCRHEAPVGWRKLIYWYAIIRILTFFRIFFPFSSTCSQSISLRTNSSPLCLANNSADANALFPITLIFLPWIKRNYLFCLIFQAPFSWSIWDFVYHFTWELVLNQLCIFSYY